MLRRALIVLFWFTKLAANASEGAMPAACALVIAFQYGRPLGITVWMPIKAFIYYDKIWLYNTAAQNGFTNWLYDIATLKKFKGWLPIIGFI